MQEITDVGTPNQARELVSEYVTAFDADPSLVEQLLQDDTNALLMANLAEMRAIRATLGGRQSVDALVRQLSQSGDNQTRATSDTFYEHVYSAANTADKDGAWHTWELDFTASEFDIRANDAIEVAFKKPSEMANPHYYRAEDLPATGIPAVTEKVWVRAAGQSTDCWIDAWGDA